MNHQPSQTDISAWNDLVDKYLSGGDSDFTKSLSRFLANDVNRVAVLKQAFRAKNRVVAISVLQYVPVPELQEMFEDLLFLASFSHGAIQSVRDAILLLPREWVLAHINAVVEPILASGTYDEYRRFLELFMQIDRRMAKELALRANANLDSDIKEVGEDFLRQQG